MARYRLTDAALADLERIYEYGILNFGLSQADKYYDGLVLHFQKIADSPLSHPSVERLSTRGSTHLNIPKSTNLCWRVAWRAVVASLAADNVSGCIPPIHAGFGAIVAPVATVRQIFAHD